MEESITGCRIRLTGDAVRVLFMISERPTAQKDRALCNAARYFQRLDAGMNTVYQIHGCVTE